MCNKLLFALWGIKIDSGFGNFVAVDELRTAVRKDMSLQPQYSPLCLIGKLRKCGKGAHNADVPLFRDISSLPAFGFIRKQKIPRITLGGNR